MSDRPHLTLVDPPGSSERPADALDRHVVASLPELAVRLVEGQQGVRCARRQMLLAARGSGHLGTAAVLQGDLLGAQGFFSMRHAYRDAARMICNFDGRRKR